MEISKTSAVFRKNGQTRDITATANIAAGDIKIVDGLMCMAQWPIANGETGVLKVLQRGEVVEITTDDAIGATNAGVAIYVTSAGLVSKSDASGANKLLGYTAKAVAAGDLTFEVVCA